MKHPMDGLLVLVLFGVFAACILSVLLTGASTYRRLTERDRAAYDDRTALQYLATKVRQADRTGAVTVEPFQGTDALVLSEDLEGETYCTRIYCYDGYLRELFSAADEELSPEDGEQVLAAEDLLLEDMGNYLRIQLLTESGWRELDLTLRSEGGAAA